MRLAWIGVIVAACAGPSISDSGDTDDVVVDDTDRDTDRPAEDLDSDGYPAGEDCDDLDPAINPGASEVLWNGEDDDCDGRIDADGRFEGTASVSFLATVEGVTSRWTLSCPTVVERIRVRVDLLITCEPPEGDALARQVMGESFRIEEVSNVAEEAVLNGEVLVVSSDGWSADGTGEVRFTSADRLEGGFSMRSVFARSSGTFSATYAP